MSRRLRSFVFLAVIALSGCADSSQINFSVNRASFPDVFAAGVRAVTDIGGQVWNSDATGGTFYASLQGAPINFAIFKNRDETISGNVQVNSFKAFPVTSTPDSKSALSQWKDRFAKNLPGAAVVWK